MEQQPWKRIHLSKHGLHISNDVSLKYAYMQAGNACQVFHALGLSLKSCNQEAHHQFLRHLLEYPLTPSALYPCTEKPRLRILCESVLTPQTPCYLCHSNYCRSTHPRLAGDGGAGPALSSRTVPAPHQPSTEALCCTAQLATAAMMASATACHGLLDTCCSFIEEEYIGSCLFQRQTHAGQADSIRLRRRPAWTVDLALRFASPPDCHRLVATLLGGILDAFNTHIAELADTPFVLRGAVCPPCPCAAPDAHVHAGLSAGCARCAVTLYCNTPVRLANWLQLVEHGAQHRYASRYISCQRMAQ